MKASEWARQCLCHKNLFPFLITNGELLFLQLQHHCLQSTGGSAQGFLKDCLQRLVVWVDCDVLFAVQVVMPFTHRGYDRKTLFLDLIIVSFCVAEGARSETDRLPLLKPHLWHSQMRLLEVSLGGVGRIAQRGCWGDETFSWVKLCVVTFRPKKYGVIFGKAP